MLGARARARAAPLAASGAPSSSRRRARTNPQRCAPRMGLFDAAKEAAAAAAEKAASAAASAAGFRNTGDDYISKFVDLEERGGDAATATPPDPDAVYKVTFQGAKGVSQTIEVPGDTYILDAAVEADIDLPFTCKVRPRARARPPAPPPRGRSATSCAAFPAC